MKKKLAFAALAIALTVPALAEEVHIADNSSGSESWFAYPETFTVMKDGYSVLGVKRFNIEKRNDVRIYFAVTFEECKKGFGSLYTRENPKQDWDLISQFNISAGRTVSDAIASEICTAGKELTKSIPKKPAQTPAPQSGAAKKVSI